MAQAAVSVISTVSTQLLIALFPPYNFYRVFGGRDREKISIAFAIRSFDLLQLADCICLNMNANSYIKKCLINRDSIGSLLNQLVVG